MPRTSTYTYEYGVSIVFRTPHAAACLCRRWRYCLIILLVVVQTLQNSFVVCLFNQFD